MSIGPSGPLQIRFSEPVTLGNVGGTLEAGDFSLEAVADLPIGLEVSPEDVFPMLGFRSTSTDGTPIFEMLPPGVALWLDRLAVRDLAGNPMTLSPADLKLRVVDPQGTPSPSFEDGALGGWAAVGDVRAEAVSDEEPGVDGTWMVSGSRRDGFLLAARVDVPDTEAPKAELWFSFPQVETKYPRYLRFDAGDDRIHRQIAWPIIHPVAGPGWWNSTLDLSGLRGRRAWVSVSLEPGPCNEQEARILLDGFRLVP